MFAENWPGPAHTELCCCWIVVFPDSINTHSPVILCCQRRAHVAEFTGALWCDGYSTLAFGATGCWFESRERLCFTFIPYRTSSFSKLISVVPTGHDSVRCLQAATIRRKASECNSVQVVELRTVKLNKLCLYRCQLSGPLYKFKRNFIN